MIAGLPLMLAAAFASYEVPGGLLAPIADAAGRRVAFVRSTDTGLALTVVDVRTGDVLYEAPRAPLHERRVEVVGFTDSGFVKLTAKDDDEVYEHVDLSTKETTVVGRVRTKQPPLEIRTDGRRVAITRDRRGVELDKRRHDGTGMAAELAFAGRDLLFVRLSSLDGGHLNVVRDGQEQPVATKSFVRGLTTAGDRVSFFEAHADGWWLTHARLRDGALEDVRRVRRTAGPAPGVLGETAAAHLVGDEIVVTDLGDGSTERHAPPANHRFGAPLAAGEAGVIVPVYPTRRPLGLGRAVGLVLIR